MYFLRQGSGFLIKIHQRFVGSRKIRSPSMTTSILPVRQACLETMNAILSRDEDYFLPQIRQNQMSVLSCRYLVASFPGNTAQQISGRSESILEPNLLIDLWILEEAAKIRVFVERNDPRSRSCLGSILPGRIGKQSSERPLHH
jgi:hypothetical protein